MPVPLSTAELTEFASAHAAISLEQPTLPLTAELTGVCRLYIPVYRQPHAPQTLITWGYCQMYVRVYVERNCQPIAP